MGVSNRTCILEGGGAGKNLRCKVSVVSQFSPTARSKYTSTTLSCVFNIVMVNNDVAYARSASVAAS